MFGVLLYMVRNLNAEKIGADVFGELLNALWRRMEKMKWSEKLTDKQVIECIGE